MLRKTALMATAFALVAAQTMPSFAQEWRHLYAQQENALAGVLGQDEVAGMAYLRIPFGGPAHLRKSDVKYGFNLAARMPDSVSTNYVDTRRNLMAMADLKFTPDGFEDLMVNGLSMRETEQRLAYRNEGEPSAWWTYGLMALALGIGAVVVVSASNDGFTEENAPQ
ncbi:hypothetical protein [Emcibacter sp. SYSU 3D8]|uniref:hypothetical protein n=1 Tax=Emcibacter sp. SYSU 3D8 TaxID=3133969 RepID=UPI0031FEA2B4